MIDLLTRHDLGNTMNTERMNPVEFKNALERRTKDFAVSVFRFLDLLPKKNSMKVIAYQLGKSASSIGANYREANHAESREDFYNKLTIATKEAAETCYWLEILNDLLQEPISKDELLVEARQILALFQSIGKSVKANGTSAKN